ncbi:hypothetical protein E4U53_004888 [Claviceps sorghi]|nr:hypothetical protein E4U53_004888 [Claviceps sorghi]
MASYQPCPLLEPSLEDPPSRQPFPPHQTTKIPSPMLYYVDEFGIPVPIPPPAMHPDPSLLCPDALLPNPPPPYLLPVLDPPLLPWTTRESCPAEPWTMEAISPASTASDTREPESRNERHPASSSPSSPPTGAPQPRTQTASAPFPVSSPSAAPTVHVHGRPDEPALLPPPPPRPPADDTPPYMTPRAIQARELILQCDFPRDQPPPQNPARGTLRRKRRPMPPSLKKKRPL